MRYPVRALTALLLSGLTAAALAQAPAAPADFPKQPVRMVVTFPPGGSADGSRATLPAAEYSSRQLSSRRFWLIGSFTSHDM